ncbi:MAG TPA: DUF4097 family beta strand repeat-containing protein [Streptosporangiaceae bacterium]|jgi:DUF4097 and DUF4098 domain-containing protein YvlB
MASWEFPGSEPAEVVVDLPSGSVAITAEPTDMITVSLIPSRRSKSGAEVDEITVEYDSESRRLAIIEPRHSGLLRHRGGVECTVKVPAGSHCNLRTASSDISCAGEFSTLDARTASGDVTASLATGTVQLSTASGDIWLEQAREGGRLNTASGDVRLLRSAGDLTVTTASGDIQLGTAEGPVSLRTASGDVRLDQLLAGEADINSVSGDVTVKVVPGTGVYLDLSSFTGRVVSDLEQTGEDDGDAQIAVKCRTVSGDIRVNRAPAAAAAS